MTALPLEDGRLWYETRGEGRPLVFVHGGWLNGRAWAPQIDRFADDYRVVTLDVRGHGKTGATDADRYSIELFTDDLEALLAHLEIGDEDGPEAVDGHEDKDKDDHEQPILCGLSLGSMVVQEYLSRHPDTAAGAILGGAIQSMPPVDLPPGSKSLLSPGPLLSTSLSMTGPKTTFRTMLQSIRATTGQHWLSVDPDVRAAALEAVGEVSREEYRKVFDALFRYDPPSLSSVETPTLVVHGEHEAPQVKRQGERIASTVAAGRRLTLENAGHLVNQDRPEAFNAVSAAFLDEFDAS